jgi:hypothetical protein
MLSTKSIPFEDQIFLFLPNPQSRKPDHLKVNTLWPDDLALHKESVLGSTASVNEMKTYSVGDTGQWE